MPTWTPDPSFYPSPRMERVSSGGSGLKARPEFSLCQMHGRRWYLPGLVPSMA